MRLLASTAKTGRLRVTGDRGSGSIWVDSGKIVATELTVAGSAEPKPADVLFGLLRFSSGSFSFENDARPASPNPSVDLEPVLVAAESMVVEWRSIEEVIPSFDSFLTLSAELGGNDVMVDPSRWRAIAAIGQGAAVESVGEALGMSEIELGRTLKELVELGLINVGAPRDDAPQTEVISSPVVPQAVEAPLEVLEPPPLETVAAVDATDSGPQDGYPAELAPAEEFAAAGESAAAVEAVDEWTEPVAPEPHSQEHIEPAPGEAVGEFAPSAEITFDPIAEVEGGTHSPPGFEDNGAFVGGDASSPGLASLETDGESVDPLLPAGDALEQLSGEARPASDGLFDARPPDDDSGQELDAAEMARQLANLSPKAAKAVAAAAKASTQAEREAALAAVEAEDDRVNRGLLLKFLGSVET